MNERTCVDVKELKVRVTNTREQARKQDYRKWALAHWKFVSAGYLGFTSNTEVNAIISNSLAPGLYPYTRIRKKELDKSVTFLESDTGRQPRGH